MPAPPIYDVLAARRSIRRYRRAEVPPALLRRLLTAATTAPSPHNRQPWRFAVIADPAVRASLAEAMGERLAADRAADGDDAGDIGRDVARSRERITGAPVVLAVCLTREDLDVYPDQRRAQAEYLMAVQSTAAAVQSLMLAAVGEGLGTCWMCAPLFCPDAVHAALGLPPAWEPQALVTIGWPDTGGKERPRKPLGEIVIEHSVAASEPSLA